MPIFRKLSPALALIAGAAALAAGCTHTPKERLDLELDSWIGKTPDRLVESWGAPRSTYSMDNGKKALTYEETAFVSRSMGSLYAFPRPDIYSYSDTCKITFFTDASQKLLESYTYAGSPGVCLDQIEGTRASGRSPAAPPLPPAPQAPAPATP